MDYEKKQLEEQRRTNVILWLNTAATIITGLASLVLAIVALK